MKFAVTLALATTTLVACDATPPDRFDLDATCDVLLVTGYPAITNDGRATDANGDGIVVICLDPEAAGQLLP